MYSHTTLSLYGQSYRRRVSASRVTAEPLPLSYARSAAVISGSLLTTLMSASSPSLIPHQQSSLFSGKKTASTVHCYTWSDARHGRQVTNRLFFSSQVLQLLHSETQRYTEQYLERERTHSATSEGTSS